MFFGPYVTTNYDHHYTQQNVVEMSMMGEFKFFLGLQIKQTKNGIFISQSKYCNDLIHRFGMENVKHMATPMSTA